MSSNPPPHPDPALSARGLPDFAALLVAELAAAAQASNEQPVSCLGVGEIVLSARELTGISQRALSSRADTVQATVSAIETGTRLPTIRTLIRLVEATGLELVLGLRRPGRLRSRCPWDARFQRRRRNVVKHGLQFTYTGLANFFDDPLLDL